MSTRRWSGMGAWPRGAGILLSIAFLVALLGLFLAGFVLGAALGALPGAQPFRSGESPPAIPDAGASPEFTPGAIATAGQTVLTFETAYQGCGCVVRESRVAGPELAGLTESELRSSFPDWQVQSFGLAEVGLFRLVSGMCPEMEVYRTIGLRDGHVAVFYGRPGGRLLLSRVTDVAASKLSPEDQQRLATGIVLQGDLAVERYLEGLPD